MEELKSTKITVESSDKKKTEPTKLDEWKKYKEENGSDFIFDEADRLIQTAGDDPEIIDGVYTKIVKMVFEYPKFQRELYISALGKKHKPLKQWKDKYNALAELYDEEAEDRDAPGEEADTTTLEKFGFYTEDNKYWFATQHGFTEGTNFVLEPLFHIYSMTNNRRLIRITNENNYTTYCDVPSDAMVSVDKFQNFLFSEGNFLLFINNNLFKKFLRYIGEKFPKCFEIKTFGWQPEGFWAFADGSYNVKWNPVNEMGIINHKNKNYFSPAFSEVYSELRQDDDVYENDRRFVYRPSDLGISEWSDLMQLVYSYGNNGMYAVAFLIASLFRSEIYTLYKIFPHLFLHGEKGSGKSQMAWSLSNVFQHGTPPFNLSAGTDVAFFRWLARYRDVVIWYDEYTDNIDEKRFQALKSAYDGVGREKGKMSRDSRTESDKINSASVISGQHLPQRDDNSLYSRSVVRFFVKPKGGYSKRGTELYDKLKNWEEEGLSQIITSLLDYRETVSAKFARTFSDIFDHYKQELIKKDLQVDDRILRNYTILSAIVWIFEKETPIDLKINPERFRDICLEDAIDQNDKVSSSDALGTFWKLLGGLMQEMKITNTDYDLKEFLPGEQIKITRKSNGKPTTDDFTVDEKNNAWVLYLDFNRVYQKYMEMHRNVYGTTGIGLQTMLDYARNHWSYLGLKSVHYFTKEKSTSAHMFNYTQLVNSGVITDFKKILPNPDE